MPDAHPDGYLAKPPSDKGKPVLVLHAWWGLNDTIRAFCRRLAESGFVTFAPDLYHGKVADTIAGAESLVGELNANEAQAQADVASAARYLCDITGPQDGPLSVIGFSLGASYAMDLAETDPDRVKRVVLYYGTGGADLSATKASWLGHFGELDEYEEPKYVQETEAAIRESGSQVTFYQYPGAHHWFVEPDRPAEYDASAAELAWGRTLAFLQAGAGG